MAKFSHLIIEEDMADAEFTMNVSVLDKLVGRLEEIEESVGHLDNHLYQCTNRIQTKS